MRIILASKSPRRRKLLAQLGFEFEIRTKDVPEDYPVEILPYKVPEYLAEKKADAFKEELKDNEILITADTDVILNGQILGKPKDFEEAKSLLQELSGQVHEVTTGVCLMTLDKKVSFSVSTQVYFYDLQEKDIEFYIKKYRPFDKAGSYGIQEWIGMVGIEKINGCYYNVVGLPLPKLYRTLKEEFIV